MAGNSLVEKFPFSDPFSCKVFAGNVSHFGTYYLQHKDLRVDLNPLKKKATRFET